MNILWLLVSKAAVEEKKDRCMARIQGKEQIIKDTEESCLSAVMRAETLLEYLRGYWWREKPGVTTLLSRSYSYCL